MNKNMEEKKMFIQHVQIHMGTKQHKIINGYYYIFQCTSGKVRWISTWVTTIHVRQKVSLSRFFTASLPTSSSSP